MTEAIRSNVEDVLRVPLTPRYKISVKVDADNKKIISYLDAPNTHPSYENYFKLEIARDIKENVCKIYDTKEQKADAAPLNEKVEYELPDGKKIIFGEQRYTLCDAFFTGATLKQDNKVLN